MSWNVTTNADYGIDTNGLSDKLRILSDISRVDLEMLNSSIDSAGYQNLTTLADGTSVNFSSKVNIIKDKIANLQEKLDVLVDKANYHIDTIETFENGNPVTIEEGGSSLSSESTGEVITIKKGDTLWDLAISKGYEGSEWSSIFVTKDGQPITSQQAKGFEIGDEIMYVGNQQQANTNIAFTTIEPTALTSVAALDALVLSDYNNLPKNINSELFGTTYAGYNNLTPPFKDSRVKVTDYSNGYYSWGEKHWGSDWNLPNAGESDNGIDIYPVADGIVVEKGFSKNGLGNYVAVLSEHYDEDTKETTYMITRYGHMKNPSASEVGQVISADEPLGQIGNTGNTGGASHLHLESEMNLVPGERYVSNGIIKSNGTPYTIDDIETEVREDGNTYVTEESFDKLYSQDGLFYSNKHSNDLKVYLNNNPDEYQKYMQDNNISYKYPEWHQDYVQGGE